MSQEQVFAAAMALPPESRLELAEMLYESMDDTVAPEVDSELLAELDRRSLAYERGEIKGCSIDELFDRLRTKRP